jgi:predicted secreted protein
MKRNLILAAVALALVAGCGGTSPDVNTSPATTGTVATQEEGEIGVPSESASTSTKAAKVAHLGDAVDVASGDPSTDGTTLRVTLLKVSGTVKATDGFSTPATGKRFAGARFKVTNTGQHAYTDAPSNGATMGDAEGQRFNAYGSTDTTAGPAMPSSIALSPGSSVVGWLTFEVPKASTVTLVQFGADSGFGDVAEWQLTK